MTDFFREVDEELRHDRFRRFLDRYWILLLAGAILILAGVGAFRGYDYVVTERAQEAGGRYLAALRTERDGKLDDAVKAFQDLSKSGTPGYAVLARMSLAAAIGKTDAADGAKQFDAIAADGSVDPALQNLARLRAGVLLVDTLSYDDLKKRIGPLADANNGLRNSARELLAVSALKANQSDEAGKWLDAIDTDPTASPSLHQRADAMLSLVRAGSGDATVASPAAAPNAAGDGSTPSAIPGLMLPDAPTQATPLAPAPDAQAPAPEAPAAVPEGQNTAPAAEAAPPVPASGGSLTPGTPPTAPPAPEPAPSAATPPTSDTTPNAAPPK